MSSAPRFFVPPSAINAETGIATLPPDAARHARTVLRLRAGETLFLHPNDGTAYRCEIADAESKTVTATVEEHFPLSTEPRTRVVVAQALPKTSDKIEQVFQHGTEVGAAGFHFFAAKRSVARLSENEKIKQRLERWESIVQASAEQSGRGRLPTVAWGGYPSHPGGYPFPDGGINFVLHEGGTLPLGQALAAAPPEESNFAVWVGPEGGFTDEETAGAKASGAHIVSLGPRVLRTETAALVALSQILYEREPSL